MSFLLLGARGTGKTWLLEQDFRDRSLIWANLLENREFLKYQSRPELLRQEVEAAVKTAVSGKEWVVIDEIQRVPQLLNEVHALIEDRALDGRVKFALSGSSARKLKRGGGNLLAGRALLNHLFPLTSHELGDDFDIDEVLSWGMLPAVSRQADARVKIEQLESYVAVYLREEIREEQVVRNLDPFGRFLEVAAQASGRIVNYSKIGRDCGVDGRAVARYFQILEETLIGAFIRPYHRSVRKQQSKSPRFYFFDTGVMRTLERTLESPVRESSYGYGRLFEHFIVWEMLKNNEYSRRRYNFFYLTTKDGAEIDLIVDRGKEPPVLIEIKSRRDPQFTDACHLCDFQEVFPDGSELWVVSQIDREREESGVRFLHWRTALQELFL